MVLTVTWQNGIIIHKFYIRRTKHFQKLILLFVFVNPIPLPPNMHECTYLYLQSLEEERLGQGCINQVDHSGVKSGDKV